VKAQWSFLSGIRLSRELHGLKVKVTAPPIQKTGKEIFSLPLLQIIKIIPKQIHIQLKKERKINKKKTKEEEVENNYSYLFFTPVRQIIVLLNQ
jgi:hypothetical protein